MAVRIFIGCAPNGDDAESQATLEYGLRSRSSLPVDITWMRLTRDPGSLFYAGGPGGWNASGWATPFSGFRWAVPLACGFKGRAIYMDSDLVVLGDIAELWQMELASGQVVAARDATKFCVSLWDCARARPHMMDIAALRRADGHPRQSLYFRTRPGLVRSFGPAWNYLDSHDRGEFGNVVHYTNLQSQPHFDYAVARLASSGRSHWYDGPLRPGRRDIRELFEREFSQARFNGFTVDSYIPEPSERFGDYRKRSMVGYQGADREHNARRSL